MEQFRNEVKKIATEELILIVEDLVDLYTPEEMEILKAELDGRPDKNIGEDFGDLIHTQATGDALDLNAINAEKERRLREEQERILREEKIQNLRKNGYQGYYEYTTLSLIDDKGGGMSAADVSQKLNEYALEGWRLVVGYTNELGHNSSSSGFGGVSSGTNATIDQHILILERFIKL